MVAISIILNIFTELLGEMVIGAIAMGTIFIIIMTLRSIWQITLPPRK